MPRMQGAGNICLRRPRPRPIQDCRADDDNDGYEKSDFKSQCIAVSFVPVLPSTWGSAHYSLGTVKRCLRSMNCNVIHIPISLLHQY
jgi:hypothetical protein